MSFCTGTSAALWYLPGEIGEVVPRRTEFHLPDVQQTQRPTLAWRGFTMATSLADETPGGGRDLAEWFVRNRVNSSISFDDTKAQPDKADSFWAERGGIRKRWMTHSWDVRLPHEKYFKDHPEWYAMLQRQARGRRSPGRSSAPAIPRSSSALPKRH